jgi:RimJ/RimL family protein N-acetyltransferase
VAKPTVAPLQGPRVRLRPLEEADLPRTLGWRNQEHIRPWFVHSDVITPEQHRRWFESYRERDDDFVFLIEEPRVLRKAVGQISLYRIDWVRRRAELGRLMIGEADASGRGLAREATDLLIAFATDVWGIREIELEVFETNAPALALYAACGFRVQERRGSMLRMLRRADEAAPVDATGRARRSSGSGGCPSDGSGPGHAGS